MRAEVMWDREWDAGKGIFYKNNQNRDEYLIYLSIFVVGLKQK